VKVSLFDHVHDTLPTIVDTEWEEFTEALGPHRTDISAKNVAPGFSPAEWAHSARRSKRGVLRVHFGVLDLDKLPDSRFDDLIPLLDGLRYIFYTTWSHPALQERGLWAARLIVAFSRPVLATEWAGFWPRFNHRFGNLGDPSCKDPSRLYFVPSAPSGTNGANCYEIGEGEPLDVDGMMASIVPVSVDLSTPELVKPEHVRDFAKRIQRHKSSYHKQMGARLLQMLDGRPFAEEGERDDIIFKLSCLLVEEWPRARAGALADLFSVSLAVMRDVSPSCPSTEAVKEKMQRHQTDILEELQQDELEQLAGRKRLMRAALGREHPYTEVELDQFAANAGVDRFDFQKRWIIQRDKSYYFFKSGTYCSPVTRWEMLEAAERDLAPAISAGVELHYINHQGQLALKTPTDLLRDYGQVARNVVVDLTAQYSHFDTVSDTMYEAPCPERKIEPKFIPEVDAWLHALVGSKVEKLLDWLAVVTALEEPCAALYFEGPPGCGKTLFADAVARIWTTQGPTTLEQALGSFNSALVNCPLVLADETLGGPRTAELRQFIQARVRPLRRKFIPDATLHGCVRMVITANNRDLLNSQENLSTDDIKAIIDRLFYVECSGEATAYLDGLDHDLLQQFVQDDLVASHVLHLRDTRDVKRGHRFLVVGEDSNLHRSLTTSAGLRSAVCHWLVSYLLESNKVDSQGSKLVRIHDGRLLATTRGLIKHWPVYETNEDPPPAGPLSKALSGLAEQRKHQLTAGDGKRTNYWVLDTSNLLTWADNNGYADVDELRAVLETDTPE
jgi:DNA polymerase III delta prime subunit